MPVSFSTKSAINMFFNKTEALGKASIFFLFLTLITISGMVISGCSAGNPLKKVTRSANSEWPTAYSNTGRTGLTASDLILPPIKIWSTNISSFYNNNLRLFTKHELASPIISNNTIFVGSRYNKLTAIDLESKKKLWKFKTNFPIEAAATATDELVFVGTRGGVLYAIDREKGSEVWNYKTNSSILSSPLVTDNKVFVLTTNNKVHGLDGLSGKHLWTYGQISLGNIFRRHKTSITLGKVNIFVVTNDGNLVAININNGTEIWTNKLISKPIHAEGRRTTPIYYNGKIYALNGEGLLLSFDEVTGRVIDRHDFGKVKDFIIKEDNVYVTLGGKVSAYTLSGLLLWNYELKKDSPVESFLVTKNHLVLTYNMKSWMTTKVNLEVLSLADGTLEWRKRFSEPSKTDLAFSESHGAITTIDGTLYVLKTNYIKD